MQSIIKFFLVCLLFCSSQLFASQKQTDDIATISANALYTLNKRALENVIDTYIKSHPTLKALKITESLSSETYIELYIKQGKVIYNRLPLNIVNNYQRFESQSSFSNEEVGKVVAYFENKSLISLSQEEREWLNSNPIVLSVDNQYAPMNFLNDQNRMDGLSIDYIKLIEEKIGKKITLDTHKWPIALDNALKHKTDGIINANTTPQRAKRLLFTQPYVTVPMVLITSSSTQSYDSLAQLKNKILLVKEKTVEATVIKEKYPNIILKEVATYKEALKLVSTNKAEGLFGHMAVLEYAMNEYLLPNLKKNFVSFNEVVTKQAIGVRKSAPLLKDILNKAISAISKQEKQTINRRWMGVINSSKRDLSSDEIAWIKQNPLISIAVVNNYAPYDFTDENNQLRGFHSDMVKIMNQRLGSNIVLKPFDSWKDAFGAANKGNVNGIFSLSWSKQREAKFIYTTAYHYSPYYLLTRKQSKINSLEALGSRKIAVEKDTIFIDVINEKNPLAQIVYVNDTKEAYEAVRNKKADAVISPNVNNKLYANSGLKVASEIFHPSSNLYIGVNKQYDIVASILNKGLDSISLQEMSNLRKKWLTKSEATIELGQKELNWITQNPTVKVIKFFDEPPFTLNTKDKSGYIYELIEYLIQSAGLKIEYVNGYQSYGKMIEAVENQEADILTTAPTSMDFGKDSPMVKSKSILKTPFVIIGKDRREEINNVTNLFGKKVAVVKGYIQDRYLSQFPEIKKVYVNNNDEGFAAIRSGKAQYYLNNRANTEFILSKSFFTDLHIVYELPYDSFPPLSISFAMNGQNKTLVSILNKALDQIPYKKIKYLRDKWIVQSKSINDSPLRFSVKEKEWLLNNPSIRLAYMSYYPTDANGDNIHSEYAKLLSKYGNININFVRYNAWKKGFDDAKKGQNAFGIFNLSWSKEREKNSFDYTKPYYYTPGYIIVKKQNRSIKTIEDIANKSIILKEGSITTKVIQELKYNITPIYKKSEEDMYRALSLAESNVPALLTYVNNKELLEKYDLKVVNKFYSKFGEVHIGVSKAHPELFAILNKVYEKIPKSELTRIQNKIYKQSRKIKVNLNAKEKAFIKNNPVIRIHNEKSWPPFNFYEFGQPKGYSVELMKLVAENTGLKLKFITGPTWDEFLQMMKKDELDVITNIVKNDEREEYMLFTDPFIQATMGVAVHKDNETIQSFDDILDTKVALEKGFFYHDYFKKNHANTSLLVVDNGVQTLQSVAYKKADATIGFIPVMKYIAEKNFINDLKYFTDNNSPVMQPMPLRFSTAKDKPELLSILQKGLASITPAQQKRLNQRWLGEIEDKDPFKIDLTTQEKKWIKDNVVKVGIEEWAPIVFSHGGKDFDGITGDVLRLVSQKTGLKFEVVNDLWDPLLESFKRKELDLLPATYYTQERATYGLYSDGYYKMLDYIYVKENNNLIKSLDDLKGKTLAIPKGFGTIPKIKKKFPEINIIETQDLSDSIQRVLRGEIDALYDGQIAVEYKMQEDLIIGLKGIPQNSFEAAPLHFFSHMDKPILKDILNKALKSIPPYEINKIKSKWLVEKRNKKILDNLKNQEQDTEETLWLVISAIGIFLFLLFILIIITRFISNDFIAKSFGSTKFRIIALVILCIVILMLSALVNLTLNENKKASLKASKSDLEFVLKTTQDRLETWISERKNFLLQIGRDAELVEATRALLTVDTDAQSLKNSNELKTVREFFRKREKEFGSLGFFIIDRDFISVGSRRDTNLGTTNLIAKYNPKLLEKVFEGQTVFVPPIKSDVAINNSKNEHTMFFAIPIQDKEGNVLAVMTQRLDVEGKFSDIIQSGRLGQSGESYLFSKDGFMLTKSRFREELIKVGLLQEDEKEYEKIEIKDPGINLLEGLKPQLSMDKLPLTKMAQSAIALDQQSNQITSDIYSDVKGYRDYRGVEVFGAWLWYNNLGIGLTTEVDKKEALAGYQVLRQNLLIITGLTLLLTIMATVMLIILGEKATRSVNRANKELNKLLESFDENVIASKTNTKGIIQYASKAFCEISGYTEKELLGQPQSVVRHPETPKEVFKGLWSTIQSGKTWRGEIKNRKKDGGFYWVEAIISPEFDDENNIIGYSAIRHDITSQKEVEEKTIILNTQKKELERMLTIFDEHIISSKSDLEGHITAASTAFAKITGYTVEELIGLPHSAVRHPDMPTELFEDLWTTIQSGKTWRGEVKNKTKDGGFYWVDALIEPEFDEQGEITGYSAIRQDITSKKEVEELSANLEIKVEERTHELRESQEQFSSMAANVPGVIYRCKVDAGWTMLYISDEIEKLSGYPVAEFINNSVRSFADIMHEDDIDPVATLIQDQIDKGEKFLVDYRVIDKNGVVKWVRSQGQAFMSSDDELLLDGVLFDVTEQKKLEQEIEESQKRFITLFDAAPDSISIIKDGKYIACNQKTLEIFGVESVEAFKESKPADYSPEYQESGETSEVLAPQRIAQALKDGYHRFEWIHKRIDSNENFDAEVILSSIVLGGEPHIYAVVRDISQRKELERQIVQNKLFVDTLLDSQEQIVITTDGHKLRSCNNAFLEFFSIDNMEEFTKDYDCICDRFEIDETDTYLQKYMGELSWIEYILEHENETHQAVIVKDGYERTFTVTAAVLPLGDGDIKSAVFTDITEIETIRKNIETILSNIMLPVLITSKKERKILYANEYASKQYEASIDELVGKSIDSVYTSMEQKDEILSIMSEDGYVENLEEKYKTQTGKEFIGLLSVKPILYNGEESYIGMVVDITQQKEIEEEIRAKEEQIRALVDAIPSIIFMKNEKQEHILINDYFSKVFGLSHEEVFGKTVSSFLSGEAEQLIIEQDSKVLSGEATTYEEILPNTQGELKDYITHKVPIRDTSGKVSGMVGIATDISKQKEIEEEIRQIHKHTQSSIEYASLIQHSLIPANETFRKYFDDYFTIWHPKDIVGGDIYLFEELRNEDECLLMVIDCTGHGVPGAFVTMLVKAIERQVAALIATDPTMEVSPGWILQYFNQTMKKLLKQESDDAISNAGFDGAVLYYNRKEQVVRFAGAELPLFYIEDGEFKTIKGNRHSIGYKKSDASFEFKEHIIEAKEGMQFYLTSDGYMDQNGGEKGFPFGKKRFINLLDEYKDYSFADQQEVLLNALAEYQQDEERNDDITLVGVKIGGVDEVTDKREKTGQDWTI